MEGSVDLHYVGPRLERKRESLGPDHILETTKKVRLIQQQIQTAHNHQKSYTDLKCKPLEFEV